MIGSTKVIDMTNEERHAIQQTLQEAVERYRGCTDPTTADKLDEAIQGLEKALSGQVVSQEEAQAIIDFFGEKD